MERYYSILGIPNNSSKEVIKKSYYEKMKALHPDKIHGTPLEDTATFFTAEINDAYSNLMAQFKNNNTSSTQSNESIFKEEKIYVETKGCLQYILSNNLNIIINEIYNRVKCTLPDCPSQIPWKINLYLSKNVKNSMNTHNMNYSMTSYWEGSIEYVIINKRTNNDWYYTAYEIKSSSKETYSHKNNNTRSTDYSKQKNPFSIFIKIVIAVVIFCLIYQRFNGQQSSHYQQQASYTKTAQTFVTVISCDRLNVRRTPSSANNSNIIESINVNTKVEILEKSNNGWVKIKYSNGKIGYVYSNYLSY
jgi:curved DNA-binding protein CbpA